MEMVQQGPWRDDFPSGTSPLRFFLFVSRPHWWPAVLAAVAVIAGATASSVFPYTFKMIVDGATALTTGGSSRALIVAAELYAGLSLIRWLLWRASGFAGAHWALGARTTARQVLTNYLSLHSRDYFADRFAGSLSNKISHAASGVRELVDIVLWQFLSLLVSIVISLVIAFLLDPLIGLVFVVWLALLIPLNIFFSKKRMPLAIAGQAAETKLTGMTVDLLGNISAMQEYARRTYEIERVKQQAIDRRDKGLRTWYFGETTLVVNVVLLALFTTSMVFLAVSGALRGALSAGDIVLIITIIYRLEDQFVFLSSQINRLGEYWGEIEESLTEILVPHGIVDAPGARALPVGAGAISFDAARFSYGETTVFPGLSFTIPGGQRVGLVGKSGAGKSTLIRLLLRHHELSGGAIRIDGADVAEVTQDSLRSAVAVVPQESLLFHRSIRDNIRYGKPDATDAEVEEAARRAQAHEFISRLPAGYDSLVGERGVKLSGGERQRIAIARAILKDAPILVLDEATASLDSESEIRIQTALHELMQGKTVIAIAHRLSTLREMDRIIVLDKGAIAEDGTHDELLRRGGIYAELWNHQAGGFIPDEEEELETA